MRNFYPVVKKSNPKQSKRNDIPATIVMDELKILTWNVWFETSVKFSTRMRHILKTTVNIFPDIACYQEVIPEFAAMVRSDPVITEHYQVSPFNASSYGVLTIVKNIHRPVFEIFELPTEMDRELLRTTCIINGNKFVVGNVHLESLNYQKVRERQLEICNDMLSEFEMAALVGDFNFCSERNFDDIADRPLHNECLSRTISDFVDTWPFLAQRGGVSVLPSIGLAPPRPLPSRTLIDTIDPPDAMSTPDKGSLRRRAQVDIDGCTFDSTVNGMLTKYERMRYDRIMVKLGACVI